ncbi:hypothetical protein A3H89_05680 [Candidatus Amesbacteria bacterium RIFCSPLOWO2_02_FULL_48_11]|uniref:Type 4 fimbrial biogenesis protein PilX N-terminal domain-containing protein n=4 Tax=Candidatus Amesiibacteriota TaxID=1752730 RepID=A0A1F4Z4U1_9BACT|nr:MAG: hypothetical protein UX78_C0001G0023 [Candidatus Amesbacteria bacterium GW2011_GWA2_47_11]KKU95082.1 MAG: hypothetical protein UY22_C0001G0026 [Candidatus Amesbacteria bacterium GW2011_GWC1_48_10]KKW00722.1 MAG: hypothetical protein UY33_C0006G0006 [Candidatus Amesbacteria bacterium GW2011_GWA1_48_9]OGC89846.1 MAG: hypothetical protein A2V48_04475 [Candidatus Amesbacteria bacterium RBG_19FT_COMBO_48_16]OGC95118.1 MAG: hypothetical protein A3C34_00090 [Candidatus Amesbacteria bacterium R
MKRGQTLVFLLVFVSMSLVITTAAVILAIANSQTTTGQEMAAHTLTIAESGAENALLNLLRNPAYSGGTLTVGQGQATIEVTGSDPFTINVTGTEGSFSRQVRVIAGYSEGILSVSSWQEMYP